MASTFFRRLAKGTPVASGNAFGGQRKSAFNKFRFPFGAIAAVSGGISYYYYFDSPNLVHLDHINNVTGPKTAFNPDKWIEFKLQDTARVSHNSHFFRFSFDPSAKLGLDVASCLLTRYTPIADPEAKGYFDFLIKVYPDGKMSQHFASLKP